MLYAATTCASAQKTYTQGVITYKTNVRGQDVEIKEYFTVDSMATTLLDGPATIKTLSDANYQFLAVLIDVPVASIKKAAIWTPEEVKKAMAALPTFTFAQATETKQISGFNCIKVVVTNTKENKTFDVWITNDYIRAAKCRALLLLPENWRLLPVQYTEFQQGQSTDVTISGVSEETAPGGFFSIPPGFERITKADLAGMPGN